MAHAEASFICPNCGYNVEKNFNYCPQCGQQSHLHNETFGGLIMHFIGHYFHYDSKFWQTLKALWFKPGKLTLAYWNKQRARYIPPVSLYIFISAVFFLVSAQLPSSFIHTDEKTSKNDSVATKGLNFTFTAPTKKPFRVKRQTLGKPGNDNTIHGQSLDEIFEHFMHTLPKVFFFMIPLMALVLKVIFFRRKDLLYVNHIIYALHYHSLWFSAMLLSIIYPFEKGSGLLSNTLFLATAVYFIVSLRNVYQISWARSVMYSVVTGTFYLIFISLSFAAIFLMILK
jgi:hypothetical protein